MKEKNSSDMRIENVVRHILNDSVSTPEVSQEDLMIIENLKSQANLQPEESKKILENIQLVARQAELSRQRMHGLFKRSVLKNFFVFKKTRFAFATILIGILGLFSYLYHNTASNKIEIVRQGHVIEKINLSREAYSSLDSNLIDISLANSLNLKFRGVSNLRITYNGKEKMVLEMAHGFMMVNYDSLKNKKAIVIKSAGISYAITGTRFIVMVEESGKSYLFVDHGKVAVTSSQEQETVSTGYSWNNTNFALKETESDKLKKIFDQFEDFNHHSLHIRNDILPLLLVNEKNPKPATNKMVTVVLKNGDSFKGNIISETSEKIILKTQEIDSMIIQKDKIQQIIRP